MAAVTREKWDAARERVVLKAIEGGIRLNDTMGDRLTAAALGCERPKEPFPEWKWGHLGIGPAVFLGRPAACFTFDERWTMLNSYELRALAQAAERAAQHIDRGTRGENA